MDYLMNILTECWRLLNEMSPYLLLGFLLAGLMHEFVPSGLYRKYLSGRNLRSVFWAAALGVPLPLCSCGVIPTAMSLRREGASRGATVSFLIATPQTGVDSIIATYSLMGLPFALIRPLAALVTAIFGGALVTAGEQNDEIRISLSETPQHEHHSEDDEHEGFAHRLQEAVEYGFLEMMEDIGKWLVVGLVVAGLITALVPDAWFTAFRGNTLMSILFVLVFAIPMYLCATGSIPIAVALMMKGLTPGAALVLLMAGPASNMASILVIRKVLGHRTLLLYLLSIVGGAVLFGLGIDWLLPREWFTSALVGHEACCSEGPGWFSILCTCLMILLLLNALSPVRLWKGHHAHCHCHHCEAEEGACQVQQYKIGGMHCNHCAANAEKAIRSVPGVEHASVSLEDGKASIEGEFDEQEVRQAVESLGFTFENE